MNESINQNNSYWTSVLLVGTIFGIVGSIINLVISYMQIGSEPAGSFFNPVAFAGVAICLATSLAGLVAVWHYTRDVSATMKLGRGALIGFLTGVVVVVSGALLMTVWLVIDPEFSEKITNSMIENIEAMELPGDSEQQMIDQMASTYGEGFIWRGLLFQIPIMGLLNLLTALIGVKIFADKEDEL